VYVFGTTVYDVGIMETISPWKDLLS